MGYSIYALYDNEADQVKAIELLNNHFVRPHGDDSAISGPCTDPAYRNKKHQFIVGFDYSSWIEENEREYLMALMHWLRSIHGGELWYDGCRLIM